MAKTNMVMREKRRAQVVKKYKVRRAELKETIRSPKTGHEERQAAQAKLQAMPRDASVSAVFAGTLDDCHRVVGLAHAGLIKADVERVGFDGVLDAYGRMERGQLRGRAVLAPAG